MRVRAIQASILRVEGGIVTVREGQAFNDDDPIVRAHPWLFASDVEAATAVPGERRNIPRSKP